MKARIVELMASGAIVLLPDDQKAWLPGYEMYPDFKPHEDFRERGKDLEGKDTDVIEYQDPIKNGERLVSHIRAEDDPWKSVASWSEGEAKVMEVIAWTSKSAMGIISPDVSST